MYILANADTASKDVRCAGNSSKNGKKLTTVNAQSDTHKIQRTTLSMSHKKYLRCLSTQARTRYLRKSKVPMSRKSRIRPKDINTDKNMHAMETKTTVSRITYLAYRRITARVSSIDWLKTHIFFDSAKLGSGNRFSI